MTFPNDPRYGFDQTPLPRGWLSLRHFSQVAYALDRHLRFRCANAAWDEFAVTNGARENQLSTRIVGRPFLDGLRDPERAYWETILRDMLAGGRPHHCEEIPCDAPGLERRIIVTATPTRDDDDEIDGILFVNYDVTAASQKETDEARLAGVLLMARTAAHVVNNQLALTVGYADLLASDPSLPEHLRPAALEAMRGAEAAVAVLTKLSQVLQLRTEDQGAPGGDILNLSDALKRAAQ